MTRFRSRFSGPRSLFWPCLVACIHAGCGPPEQDPAALAQGREVGVIVVILDLTEFRVLRSCMLVQTVEQELREGRFRGHCVLRGSGARSPGWGIATGVSYESRSAARVDASWMSESGDVYGRAEGHLVLEPGKAVVLVPSEEARPRYAVLFVAVRGMASHTY